MILVVAWHFGIFRRLEVAKAHHAAHLCVLVKLILVHRIPIDNTVAIGLRTVSQIALLCGLGAIRSS